MDKILFLLAGASLASAGLAEPQRDAQTRDRAQMLRSYEYDAGRYTASPDQLECLVRKSTNIQVCHSRETWRAIAKRIERRNAPKS